MPDSKLQSHGQQTTATPPRRPSILVTDLQMPNMDGIELVREVKRTDPGLPILLITSSQNMDVAEAALRAGATSFSPKHSLATDLVGTITQVLDVAQRMRYTHSETFCAVPEHQAFVLNNEASLIGPTIENLQNGLPKWSQADRLQIGMAVEEALTNAMHHGNLEVSSVMATPKRDITRPSPNEKTWPNFAAARFVWKPNIRTITSAFKFPTKEQDLTPNLFLTRVYTRTWIGFQDAGCF
jgi:CheY-like chemotaxis protein